MHLQLDTADLKLLVHEVIEEVLTAIDWPVGRLALTEAEAAQACGVGRHVLRDLRLAGKIHGRKLGKRTVYARTDLLAALGVISGDDQGSNPTHSKSKQRK